MDLGAVLAIILILYGVFTLYGVLVKPDFYWNRGRVKEARRRLGERFTVRLYVVMALIMLVVGGLTIMGIL